MRSSDSSKDLFRTFRKGSSFFERPPQQKNGFLIRIFQTHADKGTAGKKILFFSDLHLKGGKFLNLFGGKNLSWDDGSDQLKKSLQDISAWIKPDILLFGGDLISFSCMIPQAEKLLRAFPQIPLRIAVCGNWDKRRRLWLPYKVLDDVYSRSGWKLLCNEGFADDHFYFYGCDDAKIGLPEISREKTAEDKYSILLSHNPDGIMDFSEQELSSFDLALCGHTHGGQIRIPLFGAVRTSSDYWKRFEYGAYRSEKLGLDMFVSSGIGTTLLRLRFLAQPEVLVFEFV